VHTTFVRCDFCDHAVDDPGSVREVASWLILDCPHCRRQSDVTFKMGTTALSA
jgi:hypothetical protein